MPPCHVHVHMAALTLIALCLHASMSPCHVHADRHVHVHMAVLRISSSNGATRCRCPLFSHAEMAALKLITS
eukprot:6564178-Karenia_brevis.AAC.1